MVSPGLVEVLSDELVELVLLLATDFEPCERMSARTLEALEVSPDCKSLSSDSSAFWSGFARDDLLDAVA